MSKKSSSEKAKIHANCDHLWVLLEGFFDDEGKLKKFKRCVKCGLIRPYRRRYNE